MPKFGWFMMGLDKPSNEYVGDYKSNRHNLLIGAGRVFRPSENLYVLALLPHDKSQAVKEISKQLESKPLSLAPRSDK
jgi:hypothetical protein